MAQRSPSPRLGASITFSAVLHGSVVAAALLVGARESGPLPPVYRVDLVAAPPGPRAIGEVSERPSPPSETPTPPPKRAETAPTEVAPPSAKPAPQTRKPVTAATQTQDAKNTRRDTPAPKAGGGPTGGRGSDVANVQIEGIAFPFPAYIENIVTQIAVRFKPRNPGALRADVVFMIRRDGTITGLAFRQRSGNYAFDLEARGAIEAAANAGAFGALPDGFGDDVLPVIFSFDPQLIR